MYLLSKPLQMALSKIKPDENNIITTNAIIAVIRDLLSNIKNIDESEVGATTISNILSELNKAHGKKRVNIKKIIERANRIAHREWLSKILVYHFVIALCFEHKHQSNILNNYMTDEMMFIPLGSRFVNPDDIVNIALNTPLHQINSNTDAIASSLAVHNCIIIRGPKGCGKKSTILNLIKGITLKKYPLLYNSNILLNPNSKGIQEMMSKYRGACTIGIMTATTTENLFPRPSWSGTTLSEQLKLIYLIDDENKQMENSVSVILPFISSEIRIETPKKEDIVKILEAHIQGIQPYIGVQYNTPVLEYIVQAAERFDNRANQPVKSLNLLLEVLSHNLNTIAATEINSENIPPSLEAIDSTQAKELARVVDIPISNLVESTSREVRLDISTVENFIIKKYDLSNEVLASMMSTNIREHLRGLKVKILDKVFGQNEAVETVVRALWRRGLKLDPMNRSTSFMFIGPTGTGKTHLAKTLSTYLLGDESRMVRFDMSEYMERHEVSKLIGSPPGYVGSNQPGRLTEEVIKNPHAVLLFDEIEKAHRDIMNIFLQILDDGRLTDNHGRTVDFSKTIIIMTSNIGTDKAYNDKKSIGFIVNTNDEINRQEIMKKEAEKEFKPEFINRIDKIIVYNSLSDIEFKKIIITRIQEIVDHSILTINIEDMDAMADTLLKVAKKKPYNINKYNAREIKRVIVEVVESGIIDYIDKHDTKMISIDKDLNFKTFVQN